MNRMPARLAHRVSLPRDDRHPEPPGALPLDAPDGAERPEPMACTVYRQEAIQAAADETMPGDVVVIAGKGHETTQTIGTEKRPFDDREVARRYFG